MTSTPQVDVERLKG
jgi:hypothetical protein